MDSLARWPQTYDFGERHERILPVDTERALDAPRRAFGRYSRLIGPFSSLIRRRWLAAAARSART